MDQATDYRVAGDAIAFTGTWREFLPIAASNFFLTILTLGVYRFWAKARERRYLWNHSLFIDDRLEWTGTGKEMFIGFLAAMLVAVLPLFLLNMLAQSLILRGQPGMAVLVSLVVYLLAIGLFGFARFRALRYRLSRTWWHGIRGGSHAKGGHYAWSSIWKSIVGFFCLSLLIPWSMTSLWNERWNAMSFGPHEFTSGADTDGLVWRWALVVFTPLVLAIPLFFGIAAYATPGAAQAGFGPVIGMMLLLYAAYFVAGIWYYAAYFRAVIGNLQLGALEFTFDAGAWDLVKLLLGDIGLVIGTLGFGWMFLHYRHWSFFIRHLGATGEVELESFTQSLAAVPREAEGFADAFDIGAL